MDRIAVELAKAEKTVSKVLAVHTMPDHWKSSCAKRQTLDLVSYSNLGQTSV